MKADDPYLTKAVQDCQDDEVVLKRSEYEALVEDAERWRRIRRQQRERMRKKRAEGSK